MNNRWDNTSGQGVGESMAGFFYHSSKYMMMSSSQTCPKTFLDFHAKILTPNIFLKVANDRAEFKDSKNPNILFFRVVELPKITFKDLHIIGPKRPIFSTFTNIFAINISSMELNNRI